MHTIQPLRWIHRVTRLPVMTFLWLRARLPDKHSDSLDQKKGPAVMQTLFLFMVAGDGIEPPTRGFSIPCSTN